MQKELEAYRASTPQSFMSVSRLDGSEKKKRRKVVSIRRFKVSQDGTRRLISERTGRSQSAAQREPNESCVVEPFYVPVNTHVRNKNKKNFWDDTTDKVPYKQLDIQISNMQNARRAASAVNKTTDAEDKMKRANSRLNKTELNCKEEEIEFDEKKARRVIRVIRKSRNRSAC